jgi:hypothetical protein
MRHPERTISVRSRDTAAELEADCLDGTLSQGLLGMRREAGGRRARRQHRAGDV